MATFGGSLRSRRPIDDLVEKLLLDVPPELLRARRLFADLLERVLLRGTTTPQADIARMLDEAADAEVREAIVFYITTVVFHGALVTALLESATDWSAPTNAASVWPDINAETIPMLVELMQQMRAGYRRLLARPGGPILHDFVVGVAAAVPPPPSGPKRRGRPIEPELGGFVISLAAEALVPKTPMKPSRPRRGVVDAARLGAHLAGARWTAGFLEKKLYELKRRHPIPTRARGTLLLARLAVLVRDPKAKLDDPNTASIKNTFKVIAEAREAERALRRRDKSRKNGPE